MLRDFHSGHEAWYGDGNIDPNEELAHYAEHGFEAVLDKASGAKADKIEGGAMEHFVTTNSSDTAALPAELETLPALGTEVPIPDAFVPAQPVSPLLLQLHAPKPASNSVHQLTFSTVPSSFNLPSQWNLPHWGWML